LQLPTTQRSASITRTHRPARAARPGQKSVIFPVAGELPQADAVYLGGGYPELHAAALKKSKSTKALRSFAEDGMPVYGECGGLMYLCGSLETEGRITNGRHPARSGRDEKKHWQRSVVNGAFARTAALWPGTVAVRATSSITRRWSATAMHILRSGLRTEPASGTGTTASPNMPRSEPIPTHISAMRSAKNSLQQRQAYRKNTVWK